MQRRWCGSMRNWSSTRWKRHDDENERREDEERVEQEKEAAEQCCAQVRAKVTWRRVVVVVPIIKMLEFWELSQTLGVDQETGPPQGKGN